MASPSGGFRARREGFAAGGAVNTLEVPGAVVPHGSGEAHVRPYVTGLGPICIRGWLIGAEGGCLLYTSPSPRD
eukprot:9704244-Alexandrium_andersonii.AAC.1